MVKHLALSTLLMGRRSEIHAVQWERQNAFIVRLFCVHYFSLRVVLNGHIFFFAQIVHRDLAARNVLLTTDRVCKVADFGFARDVADTLVYERKSEGRLPIRWMAPESLYDNLFSAKSDVWSFGVFMWEVVTLGSTPYPGLAAAEVVKKVSTI
jgi:serine/threonine protein kinase